MRTLFIDLASNSGCIAAVDNAQTSAIIPVDHRVGDAAILPLIDELLRDAAWNIADVHRIACASGPGGFTSLRVAVTLANTLADQLSIPIAGVHVSDIYFKRLPTTNYQLPTLWLHSTRKTHLFIRGGQWDEPTLVSIEDIESAVPSGSQWMGELIPVHREIIEKNECREATLLPLGDALPACIDTLKYQNNSLVPWYGRGW